MSVTALAPSPEVAASVFAIRAMEPGDLAFVLDSWLRSAWDQENRKLKAAGANSRTRERAGRSWFSTVRPFVEGLLGKPTTVVLIACDREDRTHIAGWIAWREGVELRTNVKHAYRPWGVDRLLRAAVEAL